MQVICNGNFIWSEGNSIPPVTFKDLIETNKNHGIQHLILSKDNGRVKVYAKTWSEIFADFEIKHKFLDDKLKLEREQLTNELKTC
jgi:hypothetical protein